MLLTKAEQVSDDGRALLDYASSDSETYFRRSETAVAAPLEGTAARETVGRGLELGYRVALL